MKEENKHGGPAIVRSRVRIPLNAEQYRFLTPSEVAQVYEAGATVVERLSKGGDIGEAVEALAVHYPDYPERPAPEPAYTVVGERWERQPWSVVVFTHNGPEAALDLAHAAYAEQFNGDELKEVTAILAGEAKLVDFDRPETWTAS